MDTFALRLIIPGIFFTVVGPLMFLSPDFRSVAIGPTIAGPLALGLGIYFLRRRQPPTGSA